MRRKKCPQCKEAWKKAKALEKINHLIKNQKVLEPEFSKTVDNHFFDL